MRTLSAAVGIALIASAQSVALAENAASNPLIATFLESRYAITSFEASAKLSNRRPVGGSTTAEARVWSDFLEGTRRLDYDLYRSNGVSEGGADGKGRHILRDGGRTSEHWAGTRDFRGNMVGQEVILSETTPGNLAYRAFDLRAIGVAFYGDFTQATSFETAVRNRIEAYAARELSRDGAIVTIGLSRVSGAMNVDHHLATIVSLDTSRDCVPVRCKTYSHTPTAEVDFDAFEQKRAVEFQEIEYVAVDGNWLPSHIAFTRPSSQGDAVLDVDISYASVNRPISKDAFDRGTLLGAANGRIVDTRTPEPIIVEEIMPSAMTRRSDTGVNWQWYWPWVFGAGAVLTAVVAISEVIRRKLLR